MIMGYDGMAAVQALGIGCIDSSCRRVSNNIELVIWCNS